MTWFKTNAKWILFAAYSLVISLVSYNLGSMGGNLKAANLETKQEIQRANRTEAARKDENITADKEKNYAAITLDAVEKFNFKIPNREYIYRTQLVDANRLRDTATTRAAYYHSQALGSEASRIDLANRCEALDRSLMQGREVVIELSDTIRRRDSEVEILRMSITAHRQFIDEMK